jgi:Polycystin cation channel
MSLNSQQQARGIGVGVRLSRQKNILSADISLRTLFFFFQNHQTHTHTHTHTYIYFCYTANMDSSSQDGSNSSGRPRAPSTPLVAWAPRSQLRRRKSRRRVDSTGRVLPRLPSSSSRIRNRGSGSGSGSAKDALRRRVHGTSIVSSASVSASTVTSMNPHAQRHSSSHHAASSAHRRYGTIGSLDLEARKQALEVLGGTTTPGGSTTSSPQVSHMNRPSSASVVSSSSSASSSSASAYSSHHFESDEALARRRPSSAHAKFSSSPDTGAGTGAGAGSGSGSGSIQDTLLQPVLEHDEYDHVHHGTSSSSSNSGGGGGGGGGIRKRRERSNSAPDVLAEMYDGNRPLMSMLRPHLAKTKQRYMFSFEFWLMMLQLLIALVISAQVMVLGKYDFAFRRDAFFDWNNILFPPKLAPTDHVDQQVNLITQNQTIDTVQLFVDTYYTTLWTDSVDYYRFVRDADNHILPVTLTVTSNQGTILPTPQQPHFVTTQYKLSKNDLGPLSQTPQQLRIFFDRLEAMTISFTVDHLQFSYRRFCVQWTVSYVMDFSQKGTIVGTIDTEQNFCNGLKSFLGAGQEFPSVILVIFGVLVFISSVSLIMILFFPVYGYIKHCRQASSSITPYSHSLHSRVSATRSSTHHSESSDDDDDDDDDDTIFDRIATMIGKISVWWLIGLFGDLTTIVVSSYALHRGVFSALSTETIQYLHFFLGLSGLLCWVRLVPRFQHFGPRYNLLLSTMRLAMPFLVRFFLGILPVYMGFSLFGVLMFSTVTRKFRDLGQTAQSLFAILNGDMIEDSYTDLMHTYRVLGQVYLYLSILLFLLFVTKLILAGIEFYFFLTVPAAAVIEYGEELKKKQQQTGDGDGDGNGAGYDDYGEELNDTLVPSKHRDGTLTDVVTVAAQHELSLARSSRDVLEGAVATACRDNPRLTKHILQCTRFHTRLDQDTDDETHTESHPSSMPVSVSSLSRRSDLIDVDLPSHSMEMRPMSASEPGDGDHDLPFGSHTVCDAARFEDIGCVLCDATDAYAQRLREFSDELQTRVKLAHIAALSQQQLQQQQQQQ